MTAKTLTPPQLAMLASLHESEAKSKDSAVPLRTWQGKTAGVLARRGLIALDLHRSTLRQIAWLTIAGTRMVTETAALTVQSLIG